MSRKRKKRRPRRILRWGLKLLLVLLILSILPILSLRYFNPPFTAMMAYHWVENRDNAGNYMPSYMWRPLKDISPHLRRAVLAGEDQRFLSHHGFDFIEMNQALKDISSRKGTRGASTITMQTARSVFLWPERSWLRKAIEAYCALLMELFWSKERILEVYLNTVDWGDGIMGAEAAARKYFHVPSARLTRDQAALLTAILPSPHRWSPTKPNTQLRRRQGRILRDMARMPLLS
ncbi:MAG: monofunctional biosynthetic peptidoglycan transglycosylase [Desulfobacteraceae bacterium]|nr:monofunctional biosynthetic peptidoglycan transglycosylase [Desulfobacteraceae bacterium]